jgi:hypothetical protein
MKTDLVNLQECHCQQKKANQQVTVMRMTSVKTPVKMVKASTTGAVHRRRLNSSLMKNQRRLAVSTVRGDREALMNSFVNECPNCSHLWVNKDQLDHHQLETHRTCRHHRQTSRRRKTPTAAMSATVMSVKSVKSAKTVMLSGSAMTCQD